MNIKKILVTLLIVYACMASVWAGKHLWPKYASVKIEDKYKSRSQGNPKASTWIIEYLDFECSTCRESMKLMGEVIKNHPDDIYFQVRYYPLIHNHLYALKSGIYAECGARQDKFREYSDKIFDAQEQWAKSKNPDVILMDLARQAGLDEAKMTACIEDPSVKAEVLADRLEGKSLGITMTPTFFVNGKKIDGIDAIKLELETIFAPKTGDAKS